MPIQFPPYRTGDNSAFTDARLLARVIPYPITVYQKAQKPIVGAASVQIAVRTTVLAWDNRLRFGFRTPEQALLGVYNLTLSGVSRDSSGNPLGTCRILIFRTEDNSFVMETMSDANGLWSVTLNKGGPFFLVEYRAGSPDVAGTSVNTLLPS